MPQHFVEIVNRGTYTNPARASWYIGRGLAEEFFTALNRQVLQIRMLESAELARLRSRASAAIREANVDDGIPRRWVSRAEAKQLRPTSEVGTGRFVTKHRDMLRRPQYRIAPVRKPVKP